VLDGAASLGSGSSSSSHHGSSSRKSKSSKKRRKDEGAFEISAPVNMVHKTHVDKDFTWSSEVGGNVADQFMKGEKLGEGAYGAVYQAHHVESNFMLALKIIKMSASKSKQDEIMREIDVLKRCSSTYIVQYYGCFFTPSSLHILMDFCEMGSLYDMMKALGEPLTESECSAAIWGSIQGLAYLHSQNIIHRDMKVCIAAKQCKCRSLSY
jgi:serine/threonine protein kinase